MDRCLSLEPPLNLAEFLAHGELVAFNVGQDRAVYLVFALRPLNYQIAGRGGAIFPVVSPAEPQSYRVIVLSQGRVALDRIVEGERYNIHDIQPLPDELLLVCARSHYRGVGDFDRNGRVYSRDGRFLREMLLGDGIESVQADSNGIIWTSYLDEGVIGNFGWRRNRVGASGLVAWDAQGSKLYEFQPRAGLDIICDCYALNVAGDNDVWIYYYTKFPLVRLRDRKIASIWNIPHGGSHAFAVGANHVLFRGDYEDCDRYRLYALGANRAAALLATVTFCDESGEKLVARRAAGRGDSLFLLQENLLYRVDIAEVLRSVG